MPICVCVWLDVCNWWCEVTASVHLHFAQLTNIQCETSLTQ